MVTTLINVNFTKRKQVRKRNKLQKCQNILPIEKNDDEIVPAVTAVNVCFTLAPSAIYCRQIETHATSEATVLMTD